MKNLIAMLESGSAQFCELVGDGFDPVFWWRPGVCSGDADKAAAAICATLTLQGFETRTLKINDAAYVLKRPIKHHPGARS